MDATFNPLSIKWSRNADASDVEYSSIGLSPKRLITVLMLRCSSIDLGKWFDGKYSIPSVEDQDGLDIVKISEKDKS